MLVCDLHIGVRETLCRGGAATPDCNALFGSGRVHFMDRLARNLDDLRKLVRQVTPRGVRVVFLKESLSFVGETSTMSQLLLSGLRRFGKFEMA